MTKKKHSSMPEPSGFESDPSSIDAAINENADVRSEDDAWPPAHEQRDRPGSVMAPYETADYVEKAGAASPSTVTSREMYVERMKANLEERGIAINALAERAEGLEPTVRSQYLEQIANLRALQDRATDMLQSLSQTSESAWRSMSEGVDVAYEGLHSALDSVMARFRPER